MKPNTLLAKTKNSNIYVFVQVNEKGETEEKTDYEDKITNLEMKIKEKNKEIDFGKEEIDNLKQGNQSRVRRYHKRLHTLEMNLWNMF